jgi:hypothetical protein
MHFGAWWGGSTEICESAPNNAVKSKVSAVELLIFSSPQKSAETSRHRCRKVTNRESSTAGTSSISTQHANKGGTTTLSTIDKVAHNTQKEIAKGHCCPKAKVTLLRNLLLQPRSTTGTK